MPLTVELFTATSTLAQHPAVNLDIPADYKIIGGGAFDNWSGAGNLLTASYPLSLQTWVALGKDHEIASPATITAYAIAVHDPTDEWDVTIASETSDPAPHPQAVAFLPEGYTLTGGGAAVDYSGAGNLLTASFPNSDSSWEVRSKDHDVSDPARITAFAIGMRPKSGGVTLQRIVRTATGSFAPHPTAQVCLDAGWILSGGGALDNWDGDGNLLTASYPVGSCWLAAGKDHIHSSPAYLTVFAIGIK